ncbi:hypothetical protein [Primorskyibacter sp. S87]|uniref:hypothetical protein n=1 Tax=Primorskyibacter sp. S87 TaxID=3415126 RepID=UPI003C7A1069
MNEVVSDLMHKCVDLAWSVGHESISSTLRADIGDFLYEAVQSAAYSDQFNTADDLINQAYGLYERLKNERERRERERKIIDELSDYETFLRQKYKKG